MMYNLWFVTWKNEKIRINPKEKRILDNLLGNANRMSQHKQKDFHGGGKKINYEKTSEKTVKEKKINEPAP